MAVDRSRLPELGPEPAFAFPRIERHRLPNGLDVRTVEHHSVPVVTFLLFAAAGSGTDPAGLEGLAALSADMLDEGTGARSALDVSEALARLGAEYDVDVGADVSSITLTTLTRLASRGAALLADLVVRPSLLAEDFERVRQLRLDRLRQLRDVPSAVAERAFLRLVFHDHPYGHLAIGTDASVRHIALDAVHAFHRRRYRPSAATLVVVGALSHAEMRDLASTAFGDWSVDALASASPDPAALTPPPVPAARVAIVPRERAAQSQLRIGHLAPPRNTPDYAPLVVMNAVLGGQFVSRLNLKLREEKGYTYGARTGFDWHRGVGAFSLEAGVDTGATADAVNDALRELADIRDSRPVTEHELSMAKATITRGYPRGFETAQQVARAIAQLAVYDLPDDYFAQFVPRVHDVTIADVTRVARTYVDPDRCCTLIVGDYEAVAAGMSALNLGEPLVLPTEGA